MEEEIIKAYALENALAHQGKAEQGAIIKSLFAEGLKKENIQDIIPNVEKILKQINSLPIEKQKKEFENLKGNVKKREIREGLPELSNAMQGEVVMRFAPFPSGPLHIGNTRQLILNDEYAKMYNGKLILVIDDTIGSEKKPIEPQAYKLIEEGVRWLGINYDKKIIYKSDRLEKYYDYADELIKKGYMYVCSCPQEQMQELRRKGIECSCRNLPAEKQVERWKHMFNSEQGEFTVRLKTNMQHPNPAFRDRVMFKISEREHPRLKKKYKIWPTLEFSWAIDDHLLGITHIIRGIDLQMETEAEKFIWDIFKWEHPEVIHTGHFAISGIKLSKSKGAQEVHSGEYIGWNDPRTWSLQSLKDRGIRQRAIREFILNMGLTKSNSTIEIDILYALNRKYLEKCPRYFFVPEPVKIHIKACPELIVEIPLHRKENLGFRKLQTTQDFFIPQQDFNLMENENYRLLHLINFQSEKVLKPELREFRFISQSPDDKLGVKFIQWLPATGKNIKVKIRMPDNSVINGLGEAELGKLTVGSKIQLERFGFARLYKKDKEGMEFWFAHR